MATLQDVRFADWQPKLNDLDGIVEGVDDVHQCITTILTTPKGSDPHRPEFGSGIWRYVDHPVDEAIPNVIREGVDALRRWETRIDIVRIVPTVVPPAGLRLRVEWRLVGRGDVLATEVPYGTA